MTRPALFSRKNLIFFSVGALLLFLFFAFTLWVRTDSLRQFDFNMTVKVQNKTPLKLDPFFSFLSVAGRFEYTISLLIIILLVRRKMLGFGAVVLFGLAHIFELIGKTLLYQPAPPQMFLRSQFSNFPGLYVHTEASYPSGHSLRIMFLSVLVFYLIFKAKKLPQFIKYLLLAALLFLTFLMLYSRVSLGEHWTTDVIGGTFLGTSFGIFSLVLF